MMTKKTSKGRLLALKLAIVPIVALVAFVFCVRSSEPAFAQSKKVNAVNLDGIKSPKEGCVELDLRHVKYENGRIISTVEIKGKRGVLVYKDLPPAGQRGLRKQLEPLKKVAPTSSQLAKWCNTSKYDLWIDGKQQTDNSILQGKKSSDFCIHWKICYYLNKDIGKFKGKQFAVHLMTNAYYEKDRMERAHNLKELLK